MQRAFMLTLLLAGIPACAGRDFSIMAHKGRWPSRAVDLRLVGSPPTPAPSIIVAVMNPHPWAGGVEEGDVPEDTSRGYVFLLPGDRSRHILDINPGVPASSWDLYVPGRNLTHTDDDGQFPLLLPWPPSSIDRTPPSTISSPTKSVFKYERSESDDTPFRRFKTTHGGLVEAVLKVGWMGCTGGELDDRNVLQFLPDPEVGSSAHLVGPWDPSSSVRFLPVEHVYLKESSSWILPAEQILVMRRAGDSLELRGLAGYRSTGGRNYELLWLVWMAPLPHPRWPTEGGLLGEPAAAVAIVSDLR